MHTDMRIARGRMGMSILKMSVIWRLGLLVTTMMGVRTHCDGGPPGGCFCPCQQMSLLAGACNCSKFQITDLKPFLVFFSSLHQCFLCFPFHFSTRHPSANSTKQEWIEIECLHTWKMSSFVHNTWGIASVGMNLRHYIIFSQNYESVVSSYIQCCQ